MRYALHSKEPNKSSFTLINTFLAEYAQNLYECLSRIWIERNTCVRVSVRKFCAKAIETDRDIIYH